MKFLPFENITYKTNLDSKEIISRITEIIEPKKMFRITGFFGNSDHKPYQGSIEGKSFSISRIIGYRNSFLPKIEGIIDNRIGRTKVHVKMRLHMVVLVFITIWMSIFGIICFTRLSSWSGIELDKPPSYFPFFMLVFGYILVTGGFKYESIKSKKYLAELLEAEIDEYSN